MKVDDSRGIFVPQPSNVSEVYFGTLYMTVSIDEEVPCGNHLT